MAVEDKEEVEEEYGGLGIDELVGGEGGGDLKKFKGVLRTNFGTCKGIISFVSKRGLVYIEKVSSGCLEEEAPSWSKMEGNG